MRAVSTPSRPARQPAQAPGQRRWGTRLVRGRPGDPAWARPALIGLLLATAVLYLAGLSRSGYANEFYAAAVQGGRKSWKAFLFGSPDSGNFITAWVKAHFTAKTAGGMTVYDLTAPKTGS